MSLDFEFMPLDVELPSHPRILEVKKSLRAAALGLWAWGSCYARQYRTGGHLRRSVILGAFAMPERQLLELLAELVRVGLWVEREDLSIDIFNYERKGGAKSKSTDRVRRFRERSKTLPPAPAETLSETQNETHETRFRNVSPLTLNSPSSSVSNLFEENQKSEAKPSAREGPPAWFAVDAVATVETAGLKVDNINARWLEYVASRERKRWQMSQRDAVGWLTAVMRMERTRGPTSGVFRTRSLVQSAEDRCWDMPAEMP